MTSTSVRVPEALLERLHRARVPGVSLAEVIETAVERAGGADAVRRQIEARRRRDRARAQVARLRRAGHRSVVLEPAEQLTLSEGARRKVALEERRGVRHLDEETGTLVLAGRPVERETPRANRSRGEPVLEERDAGGTP